MAREVFFQGLARWFERREMRLRLRRLGLAEPAVELEWARMGDGFRVHGMGRVEVARVELEGDGRVLRVAMAEDCPYGWRVTYHGNLRSARREVEGQVWYAACLALAREAEEVRDRDRRREAAERFERELGLERREVP